MISRRSLVTWLLTVAVSPMAFAEERPLAGAREFLKQHCQQCHGPHRQENDLRFDTLGNDLTQPETLEHWQAVIDQLNLGTMPPPDAEDAVQPPADEVQRVVDLITAQLRPAYAQQRSTGGKTVMRRLNRIELRSALRDLLYLEGNADYASLLVTKLEDRNGNGKTQWNSDDPTREFPADQTEDGFDNIGSRLVMSDFLLKQLINAAEYSLQAATFEGEAPTLAARRFSAPIRTEGPGNSLQRWSREFNPAFDGIYQRYREPGASTSGLGRVSSLELARGGVGLTTKYRITIEASAHNQRHPWGEVLKSRQDERLILGLHMADSRRGGLGENPTSTQLTEWALPGDGSKQVLAWEGYLDATWFPWVGWENAPYVRGLRPSQLVESYLPEAYRPPPEKDATKEAKGAYEPAMAKALFAAEYQGPHLRIHSITVEPLDKTWPPKSHVALYGEDEETSAEALLLQFARRAFRRPVQPEEIARYVALVRAQQDAGKSRNEALRAGYTAIIASPRFYYLHESAGELDSHQLAARLGLFLWSSLPDEELFALAEQDKLRDRTVLRQQAQRMLDDPKGKALVRNFTHRWLRIDKLGSMPPPGGFYFHREMETEMREQVDAYFAHLVRTNGSVREIVDSDYTFLNERVAQWIYRRDDVWGDAFRRVPAKPPHGGGILTMPAVMTATANGVDTSPVVRGVWVLESVLGTPPSPPPPDVEPLSPDLRDAKTIREQLIAHREQQTCNRCHRKIDPLGFAFENFDELGLWRTHYRTPGGNLKIDPSSTLADGAKIEGIADLKRVLLQREDQIVRNLTEKLLTYASGRTLEPADRLIVDDITSKLEEQQGGVRDLILLVIESEIFRTK